MVPARRTAVIGGGMAGCAAARELARAGRRVTLFEKAGALGGRARSWHRPEIEPDTGFNPWFTDLHRMLFQRIQEHALEADVVPLQRRTLVVRDGRAVELVPHSARRLLCYPDAGIGKRLRFTRVTLRETLRCPRPDVSEADLLAAFDDGTIASDWARSRLSERILDNLGPEIESLWLWRCDQASAAHAVALQAGGLDARLFVLRHGLEALADRMTEGTDLRLSTLATGVTTLGGRLRIAWHGPDGTGEGEEFDELVVATTAWAAVGFAAGLTGDAARPELARFAATQRYEPVLSLAYLVDRGRIPSGARIVPAGPGPHPVRTIVTIPGGRDGGSGSSSPSTPAAASRPS